MPLILHKLESQFLGGGFQKIIFRKEWGIIFWGILQHNFGEEFEDFFGGNFTA